MERYELLDRTASFSHRFNRMTREFESICSFCDHTVARTRHRWMLQIIERQHECPKEHVLEYPKAA